MANPGPVAGVDYAVPTNFLNPGQRPDAPLVSGVAGNIHFVKQAADADYGAFVAQHYQLYPGKICINDAPGDCRNCVAGMLRSLGRTIATDAGHSLKIRE